MKLVYLRRRKKTKIKIFLFFNFRLPAVGWHRCIPKNTARSSKEEKESGFRPALSMRMPNKRVDSSHEVSEVSLDCSWAIMEFSFLKTKLLDAVAAALDDPPS